eukprot:7962245-Pyramimonas_sp.AAC.2
MCIRDRCTVSPNLEGLAIPRQHPCSTKFLTPYHVSDALPYCHAIRTSCSGLTLIQGGLKGRDAPCACNQACV